MTAQILIVDDEPQFERLLRQRLRNHIRSKKYELYFAGDGVEALDVVSKIDNLDMVLTDINMPKMDGLTFIQRLKEVRPLLKCVIVSAYGDMQNIRTAMNLGAFDFLIKPINFKDLEITIDKTLQESRLLAEIETAKKVAAQNEKLQELHQLKNHFFSNISHELRTPLTIISGMSDQVSEQPDKWLHKGMSLIRKNSDSLLLLVNQILDLQKLEANKLNLNLCNRDIIHLLSYVHNSFIGLAESKDILLKFDSELDSINMDHDVEKVERIITNLISNAIKFTPIGGVVTLTVKTEDNNLVIHIKDTGCGIPEHDLPFVFDRFYQSKSTFVENRISTGIGLSLVKELVSLMDGDITVESTFGVGSDFGVRLPIQNNLEHIPIDTQSIDFPAVSERHDQNFPGQDIHVVTEGTELPDLLIIEDNLDVQRYLLSCLEGRYQIRVANDGEEGIRQAVDWVPDIIISDVMMPKKNGMEVCHTLKSDQRTSHIPILLLTARSDKTSEMDGLASGADVYLTKPFLKKELLLRLEKLLETRELLRQRYQSPDFMQVGDNPQREEDPFMVSLRERIMSNLGDEQFGIYELCRDVGTSRSQLHRKIKALTGLSTSHFIRKIRLNEARKMLLRTHLNISEVAYEVGFRDPKYFSRTFSEEFGESPKNLRQ